MALYAEQAFPVVPKDKGIMKKSMDDDQIDVITEECMYNDKDWNKTSSRLIVEKALQKFPLYNPRRHKEGGPSLSKAYAFYEHFTLARHYTTASASSKATKYERAEPGERFSPTELYNPFLTPQKALNEFGVGLAIYFSMTRFLGIILLIAGGISVLNIMYFSNDYSAGQDVYANGEGGLSSYLLWGSAICTEYIWVVCTNCDPFDWNDEQIFDRFGIHTDPTTGEETTLVLRNDCERPPFQTGMINLAVLGVVSAFLLLMTCLQRSTSYDNEKQTATDYSVVVQNPPPKAFDPEQWNRFMSHFNGKNERVCGVTIALDNQKLIQKLIERRACRKLLKSRMPRGMDLDDNETCNVHALAIMEEERKDARDNCFELLLSYTALPFLRMFGFRSSVKSLVDEHVKLTTEVEQLLKKEYNVAKVFVTFESEAAQRSCLEAFSGSKSALASNNTKSAAPDTVFQGKVLDVVQPQAPDSIRYLDLQFGSLMKTTMRLLTFTITLVIIAGCGFMVVKTRKMFGSSVSAPLTTVFNAIVPILVHYLMKLEAHNDEDGFQSSLFLKITIFRWVNTAILTRFVVPFAATITGGVGDLIPTIEAVLLSELCLAPFLRLLDPFGNLRKHFIAPRARTQEEMNTYFQGTVYSVAERYTDLAKILFVSLFYSAIFPCALFFGGSILIVQYFVDKYCVMRIWASAPFLGRKLANITIRYCLTASVAAFALVASYDWAQFPFDNLCDAPEDLAQSDVSGTYNNVRLLNGEMLSISVDQDDSVVFCQQHWLQSSTVGSEFSIAFPAIPSQLQRGLEWMTEDQENITTIYGWTGLFYGACYVALLVVSVLTFVRNRNVGTYNPLVGDDKKIALTAVRDIKLYVPEFKIQGFQFPILACDVDSFETQWVGWVDVKDPSYDMHNMIYDVEYEGMKRRRGELAHSEVKAQANPVFTIVKSWREYDI